MLAQPVASQVSQLIQQQRQFFTTGQTQSVSFRLQQLNHLKAAIVDNQEAIVGAVRADLGRPEFEAYFEISVVREIDHALKHLQAWVKPKRVAVPVEQFPSSAHIYPEPLGVVLIIGPWNYPLQLVIAPLIGAIAAGNCAILKPSEVAPHTSAVLADIIRQHFDPSYIAVIEGGVETSQQLLAEKFDHIFFTGGTAVGKIVMAAAAQHLTPVTLELGGKSPCIVDADIHLEYAARRITWGKFINAGQTCIAPDYLLVNRRIKDDLLAAIKRCIREFYGDEPAHSPDYARIINQHHFSRLVELLQTGRIFTGGTAKSDENYIAPTVLDQVNWDDPVMQAEIFGPILPVLEYDHLDEAIVRVNEQPKPLALYFFSRNQQKQAQVLRQTSSGTACINETVMQVTMATLPFGGVGPSGMGRYHGKASFDTFSHQKSVLRKSFLFDLNWRYAPYANKLKLLKSMINRN